LPPLTPDSPHDVPRGAPVGPSADATQIIASPAGDRAVVAWIVIASGALRGRDFRLPGGTVRIGSAPDCEIRITDDPYFSSRHAELSFGAGQYLLRDLQSTNGSYVNEARIAEHQLRDGDHLRLGLTQFVFKSFHL
jgi:pSer/pThr/pTyr-binding forkhead associated (FHA) protein